MSFTVKFTCDNESLSETLAALQKSGATIVEVINTEIKPARPQPTFRGQGGIETAADAIRRAVANK